MSLREETWGWLHPALEDLKTTADRPWDERQARFVEMLGLIDAGQHPVTAELMRRLDELPDGERPAALAPDQLDATAYEVVQTLVTEPDGGEEPTRDHGGEPIAAISDSPRTLRADDPAGESLRWVTPPERDYFAQLWGPDWPSYLAADLERRWGTDWWRHPDDYKAVWLRQLVNANEYMAAAEFEWVSREQLAALAELWGEDWRAVLTDELAARWGSGWKIHPGEYKRKWLDDMIAAGAFTDNEPENEPGDVRAETTDLLTQLAQLAANIPGIEQLSDNDIARIIGEAFGQARS